MKSKGGIRVPFPREQKHLEAFQDEFFAVYLSGAFVWDAMPRRWQGAMKAQARVWHMMKVHLSKFEF